MPIDRKYNEFLREQLRDPELAQAYLEAMSEDGEEMRQIALIQIEAATGGDDERTT